MGKGCRRRPIEVPREEFEENWDRIFKREDKNKEKSRHARSQRADKKQH